MYAAEARLVLRATVPPMEQATALLKEWEHMESLDFNLRVRILCDRHLV